MSECSDPFAKSIPDTPPPDGRSAALGTGDALDRASVRMRRCAPKERIFQSGAPVDTVFELVQGFAVVTVSDGGDRRRIVDLVQPGRLFGFTAQARHRCTAVAVTTATVCCLDLALARRNDRVAAWIEREMLAEIDRLRDVAALLGRRAAIDRIAGLFSLMRSPETPTEVYLPATRGQIAECLGLTIETVCRNLTKLKRDGSLVEQGDGTWRIADALRLASRTSPGI